MPSPQLCPPRYHLVAILHVVLKSLPSRSRHVYLFGPNHCRARLLVSHLIRSTRIASIPSRNDTTLIGGPRQRTLIIFLQQPPHLLPPPPLPFSQLVLRPLHVPSFPIHPCYVYPLALPLLLFGVVYSSAAICRSIIGSGSGSLLLDEGVVGVVSASSS